MSFHTAVWNCYYQLHVVAKVAVGFVSYPVELVGSVFPSLLTLLQLPLIEVGNAVRAHCYSIASYP